MDRKLEEQLFKKYPKLLKKSTLNYGCENDSGWYWLINNLCNCIQRYIDQNSRVKQIEVTQIKEKFGGLRFYTNHSETLIEGMIWFAEALSYTICEKCGNNDAKPNSEGWIKTLCGVCRKSG